MVDLNNTELSGWIFSGQKIGLTISAKSHALLVADITFLFSIISLVVYYVRGRNRLSPLPPGPRPLPIIGNVWDFPTTHEGRFYIKHKELYGPISSLTSFKTTYIVLNDLKAATQVLEKRSVNTSDRYNSIFSLMVGADLVTTFLKWGPELKYHRKLIQSYVNTRVAMGHIEEVEGVEARRLLLRLLDEPKCFFQHFRTYTGSVVLKLSHGYEVAHEGYDSLVKLAEDATDVVIKETTRVDMFIDNFPILRFLPHWFPGMSLKKSCKEFKQILRDFYEKPYLFVKNRRSEGIAKPSFTSYFLDKGIEGNENLENLLIYSAATLFAAGADTVSEHAISEPFDSSAYASICYPFYTDMGFKSPSALRTFIRVMVLHPHVQRHAQEEIDNNVGSERLPTFCDREKLPYVDAIIKECLRWETVIPLGVSHVCSEEETYNGYRIPKGAVILPNAWAMGRDPGYYSDPSIFNPERFLKDDPEPDPYGFAFGFGRRVCPGKRLADSTMFIAIAMILATFNISKAKDENGSEIEPDCTYLPGIVSHPTPFPCSIKPRSAKAEELIRSVIGDHPFQKGDSAILDKLW